MQAVFTGRVVAIDADVFTAPPTVSVRGAYAAQDGRPAMGPHTIELPAPEAMARAVRVGDRVRVTVETVDEGAGNV